MSGYGSNYGGRGDRPRGGGSRVRAGGGSRGGPRSGGYGRDGGRNGGYRESAGRPVKQTCPPELRDSFLEARDFLAGLISALGLPARISFGGIEPARDGRQVMIDVRGLRPGAPPDRFRRDEEPDDDDLGILIGKHGAMIDALTAITNAMMHRGESEGLFFAVDVEGYRSRRLATLRSIAQRSADRVLREGVALELAPMPPSERRIVHMTLASHPSLATESTGSGINRRVVIVPRGRVAAPADYPPEESDY